MTKLCPRGKAAAKRKFRVYPSAYANAYASKICAGKIKDPSGVKRKDFRGSKAKGGRIGLIKGGLLLESEKNKTLRKLGEKKKIDSEIFKKDPFDKFRRKRKGGVPKDPRINRAGGGLMEATARLKRQGLRIGGSVCKIAKRGQNRDAIGKNS
jgi:hypothetical protein